MQEKVIHLVGGHNIPSHDVRRRFLRAYGNFWSLYRPLADDWYIFDNSGIRPRLVLSAALFSDQDKEEQKQSQANLRHIFRGISK